MSSPYVGEIRMFGGSFNPSGWAMCNGALLPISENETLFNLIGTTFGGDGQETFGLPDLQGRMPVHQGSGAGNNFQIGETGGVESVTLSTNQIPVHNHAVIASAVNGTQTNPNGNFLSNSTVITPYAPETPLVGFSQNMLNPVGGSQPHENMQPFLVITYIISLFGIFPHQ